MNTTASSIYYTVILLQQSTVLRTTVELDVQKIAVNGYRGILCEYAGVIIATKAFSSHHYYGPFCDQHLHEAYSVVGYRLPLALSYLVLYSYSQYSILLISYILKTDLLYCGDVLPFYDGRIKYKRPYGKVQYRNTLIWLHWEELRNESNVYFLPRTTGLRAFKRTGFTFFYEEGHVSENIVFGNVTIIRRRTYYTIVSRYTWMEPVLRLKWYHPNRLDITKRMTYLRTGVDRTISFDYPQTPKCTSFIFVKHQMTTFIHIQTKNSSCPHYNLSITKYGQFPYTFKQLINVFVVSQQSFEWITTNTDIEFGLNVSCVGCSLNLVYNIYDYSLCIRNFYNMTHICYDFWKEDQGHRISDDILDGSAIPVPLCNEQLCYRVERSSSTSQSVSISWNGAQQICQKSGSSLVTINSYEELDLVRMVLYHLFSLVSEYSFLVFIGLTANISSVSISCH